MRKITSTHTVTRSAARFGVPDPKEVCDLVAQSIPLSVLQNATSILDLGQGCCGMSRAIVKRLQEEVYLDHFDAMFKVHGVDNDLALVEKAKRLGFIHSVCSDIEDYNPNMKFDVIIGNPPYQNSDKKKKTGSSAGANGLPLWVKFLKKSSSLLKEGGYMSLLVPATVVAPGSRGSSASKSLSLVSVNFDMEKFFNVGTQIALVTWVNGTNLAPVIVNGLEYPTSFPIANVQTSEEISRLQVIWSGQSDWKYMDNRRHHLVLDKSEYLVVRRMFNGEKFVYNRGLDMTKFDRESVLGIKATPEEQNLWSNFLDSENGQFLRRVTKFSGNLTARYLQQINPLAT